MYGTPSKNFPVQSRAARNETGSGMRSASPGTLAKRSASQSSAALGEPQHIIERRNNRQVIFASDTDFQFFRDAMVTAADPDLPIHAYVWMGNHIHLLATSAHEQTISRVFHSVGRKYVHYSTPPTSARAAFGKGATARRWWTASSIC